MTYTSNDNDGVLNSLHILGLLQCGRLLCSQGSVMVAEALDLPCCAHVLMLAGVSLSRTVQGRHV